MPVKSATVFASLLIAATWAAAIPARGDSSLAPVSEQEQNKAVALRVFDEIFNQGKFEVADEIYSKDFVNHGIHRDADLAEDQGAVHWEKQAFPDLTMSVGPVVAEGDLVSVVWIARGTNTRGAGWLPATGFKLELRGITVWRISGGRIREEWTSFDMLRVARAFLAQFAWPLIGLLCVVLILFWMAGRMIRGLFHAKRGARIRRA